MGFREGAKEIWRTIVKKPIVPGEGEHSAPVEFVGPFTTRIPEAPAQNVDSSKSLGDTPIEPATDLSNK